MEWKNLTQVLNDYAQKIRNTYQDKLISDNKIASGELLNSIEYEVERNGNIFSINLSLLEYWKFVEEGVNGRENNVGSPYSFKKEVINTEAIKDWIRMKPIIPDDRFGRLPTPDQLAFLIGRKIAREGIEPGKQLSNTLEELMDELEEAISQAITDDIKEFLI